MLSEACCEILYYFTLLLKKRIGKCSIPLDLLLVFQKKLIGGFVY